MKLQNFIRCLFLLGFYCCRGQNLVPNGDFELHHISEDGYANIYASYNWVSANPGTPDYYNIKTKRIGKDLQLPHGGKAFAGIIAYDRYEDIAEYLQVQLKDSLHHGEKYELRLFYALDKGSSFRIPQLEAFISQLPCTSDVWKRFHVKPLLNLDLSDTLEAGLWGEARIEFIATGKEKWLTIGSFEIPQTEYIEEKKRGDDILTYYYIDDVSLSQLTFHEKKLPKPADTMLYRTSVLFYFDEERILEGYESRIDSTVYMAAQNPFNLVELNGHTDSIGDYSYNLSLSQRRCEAIKALLIQKGLKPERVSCSFFADTQPATANTDEPGRQRNRRVEIKIRNIFKPGEYR